MGLSVCCCQGYAFPAVYFGYRNQDLVNNLRSLYKKKRVSDFLLNIVWNVNRESISGTQQSDVQILTEYPLL